MLTINESVKIKNCESNIPGVRIDMIDTSSGSMRSVIFRSESDSIINGITKLVKSTFENESETYYEALKDTLDSDSSVSDIFNDAAIEAIREDKQTRYYDEAAAAAISAKVKPDFDFSACVGEPQQTETPTQNDDLSRNTDTRR